ncbi:MAG: 16S rRNA (guanine(966)-N(2))-methyltransferase RsmD [Halioglobus sp.]|nr:16S rRNA (guanine(966)-N(2))-methyltransferase RsmD [Halioglobus sp.]
MSATGSRNAKQGQVRIIGGQWRGRKLSFPPADGLRPTGDRTRETLFNWLAPHIHGARCADLFAGSGALGLEALSRGAAHCDFVDIAGAAVRQIQHHLETLGALDRGSCHVLSAQQYLEQAATPCDIVFVDPPFALQLTGAVCALLADSPALNEGALIYIETAASEPMPDIPPQWTLHRERAAGGVTYRLFIHSAVADSH